MSPRTGSGVASAAVCSRSPRSGGPTASTSTASRSTRSRDRFYERRGFVPIAFGDGSGNEERQPDVRYAWRPTARPSRTVTSPDGTPIALFSSGSGPPLILVHGASADHTTFRVVGPMFAERFTVHAIDRRGRGASGDTLPYAIEREFEDVAAVASVLAAEAGAPVDVVGSLVRRSMRARGRTADRRHPPSRVL